MAQQIAVWVSNSQAIFVTPSASFLGRYTTFSAANIGLLVDGSSNVSLAQVGFNDSGNGIWMTTTAAGAPYVKITGGAFLRNRLAARVAGPAAGCNSPTQAVLDIRGDTTVWLNYVMDNNEGFRLTGRSTLTVRARGRVDQDQVRGARTGEAHIIAAGRVARAHIIRTAIAQDVCTRAIELVAGERPALPTEHPLAALPEPPEELPA